jgi:hypothetical protein
MTPAEELAHGLVNGYGLRPDRFVADANFDIASFIMFTDLS